jgi:hypothetical protein
MKWLVILVFFFGGFSGSAQTEFSSGYIVNQKGDTVKGEVKAKSDMDIYVKIMFREKNPGPIKQCIPAKVRSFGVDGIDYTAVRLNNQWVFMQVLCRGRIMFFEYKPPVSQGNEKMQSQYFVMKGGYESLTQFFIDSKAKRHIKDHISDDKELMKSIESVTMDYSNLIQTINQYNEKH